MTTSGGTRTSWSVSPPSSEFGSLARILRDLLAVLYPPRCLLCGAALTRAAVLCERCEDALPPLAGPRCVRCSETLEDPDLDLCVACGTRDRGFDAADALGPYDSGWGALVRALKFNRERAVARDLARRMAERLEVLSNGHPAIDRITYVPMHPADRRVRGFNQAQLLARGVGRRHHLPVVKTLRKVRRTPPQAGLSARERRENLRGAFRLIKSGEGNVLLIDDIYTTGSTLEECSRTLKAGGADRVLVMTVARA
jgi:ComF family protein